jgi:hypothetical protein
MRALQKKKSVPPQHCAWGGVAELETGMRAAPKR